MNTKKTNGYTRLLVIFLVAVILIFAVGIVSDGWQQDITETPKDNNGESADNSNGNADENSDNKETENDPPSEPYVPKYLNYLTGLETSEDLYAKRHTAFIFDSSSPLYGISHSDLMIELPVENGQTRLLCFINDFKNLGKIGSISATRDYISRVADFFGGVILSMGAEGNIDNEYTYISDSHLDISSFKANYYTEYNSFNYTNANLLENAFAMAGIPKSDFDAALLPFAFSSDQNNSVVYSKKSSSVKLNFSDNMTTELFYSESDKKYTMLKNGSVKNDLLNSQICYFDNCIVLFSDSVTYESENGTKFELKTNVSGRGYYFTSGTYAEITYTPTEDGGLCFYDLNGDKLVINKGKTYIGYQKSSSLQNFENTLSETASKAD